MSTIDQFPKPQKEPRDAVTLTHEAKNFVERIRLFLRTEESDAKREVVRTLGKELAESKYFLTINRSMQNRRAMEQLLARIDHAIRGLEFKMADVIPFERNKPQSSADSED